MILYTLACPSQHRFDSWFPSSAAFDRQAADGLVSCPLCGSAQVVKAIMAPAIVGARGDAITTPAPVAPAGPPAPVIPDPTPFDPRQKALRALAQAFRQTVLADAQDVGARFPEEARRMHEGDIPVRQIRGQATPAEARDLLEEGIMILPLPASPDELN